MNFDLQQTLPFIIGILLLVVVGIYFLNWIFWEIRDFFVCDAVHKKSSLLSSNMPLLRVILDGTNRKDLRYDLIETQLFMFLKTYQKEDPLFRAIPCDMSQFGFHTIRKVTSLPLILNFDDAMIEEEDNQIVSMAKDRDDYLSVLLSQSMRLFFILFQKNANIIYVKDDISKTEHYSANEYLLINNHTKNSMICTYDYEDESKNDEDDVIVLIEMRFGCI